MENKVENINIEKSKELFEYEMTEVILKLKGEFAVFSGKDTKFAEMVVDDAKLRINTPGVVQVKVEDHHVETPVVGSVQQTKTALIEVKETILQLPVIPQISDEDGRKEENAHSPRKANVWQGIAAPALLSISKVTITKELPEKSLEEVEKKIVSSVESTQSLKKKAHVTPVSVDVPRTKIKYSAWNKDKPFVQCEKRTIQKIVPEVEFDSLLMSDRLKRLSKVQAVNKADIKVPHIATNMAVAIDNSKKTEVYMVEVPQIDPAGGSIQVLPTITCESVQIKVPSMIPFEFHELKKSVIATSRKQIEFQETHSFKYEIKKPTVIREVVTVPELNHIQAYKFDNVCIKHQTIVVPDAPKCNNKRKNVDIKNTQSGVMLPKTHIPKQLNVKTVVVSGNDVLQTPDIPVVKKTENPNVREKNIPILVPYKMVKAVGGIPNIVCEMNPLTVCVPAVSFQKHKPLSSRKIEKHNIAIPIATQPRFSGLSLVEHEQSTREIEIHPVKVNGNLGKVAVSYHGAIAIPPKPEVKETVDNIIALAVAKR